ncbi:N66 matrix protein-like [Chenopodium quinoa]|uniref:N66 matrix protein-like n=1 Tax=Chenopodium quinoa TaxID=63459 RepID=UPI000B77EE86|nr:N66 matrix protein-like [Chenopodium quinoa]
MTSIKAKLESVSANSFSLPSQTKGRVTISNSSPSTSNNMPSGCVFCHLCGSYDHDSSMCSQAFVDGCDDVKNNECEHVNFVSNDNGGQRFEGPKNFGNKNSHPQGGGFDNYNNGGYRNQGNQGFRGNYNHQGYNNQNSSHGYGNQGQSQGFGNHYHNGGNSQGRESWKNNQNRGNSKQQSKGTPPGFALKSQSNGENSYSQPSSFKTNLEELIDNQTKIINTYMAVSDKKFNEMMTHNKMLETQIT